MKRSPMPARLTPLRSSSSLTRSSYLSPVSRKRASQERVYSHRRRVFLDQWPACQHPDQCGRAATDVHHMAGRDGARLLDVYRWIALCRQCHRHVTEYPALAIAQGVSYPRIGIAS